MKLPITLPLTLAALAAAALNANAATLAHQWTFNDSLGLDSVGGANSTLVGSASVSGGKLNLPGGGTFANYASVDVSATLNANSSISVESWFTMNQLGDWSKVWMFGQDTGGEPTLAYINFTPRTGVGGNIPKIDFDPTTGGEVNTLGGANPSALSANTLYHVVSIFDAGTDTMSYYINGLLADSASMGGGNITQLNPNKMRFGAGFFYGDGDLNGAIDQMSIYTGALTETEVGALYGQGPVVPEPTTMTLAALGMAGWVILRRRAA